MQGQFGCHALRYARTAFQPQNEIAPCGMEEAFRDSLDQSTNILYWTILLNPYYPFPRTEFN